MTQKNPFEIRTELLQMAKDYLDQQYHTNMEFFRAAFEEAIKQNKVTMDTWSKYVPAAYSLDELTKKAQELYTFVEKK
jgi:hypothetical protein